MVGVCVFQQKLTAEQRREVARQFTYLEENVRGAHAGGTKRTRLMKVTSMYYVPYIFHLYETVVVMPGMR